VATAALVVLTLGIVFGRGLFENRAPLDPNRIMVFPLGAEGFPGSNVIGENIATLIGNALDGTGPLRWIDGWQHLDAASRENIRDVSEDALRSIARAERCGFYVSGRVTAVGDSAVVTLLLNDATGRTDPERGVASAPIDEAWKGFSAVNELLPTLIPGGESNVSESWEHRPPAAIANFLLAEREFRRIHLANALENYQAAVGADSSFAFAALRGAQAASWNHRETEAAALVSAALRRPLTPRWAAFARGYRAYLEGRADSALAAFRAALDLDPGMAVAWLQMGETWTHLLPKQGVPDDSALLAFREATRLDSTAANPLFHMIEILYRKGDVAAAAPLVNRFLSAEPEARLAAQIRILSECFRLGPGHVAWDSIARANPFELMVVSFHLAGGGSQPACAEAGYSALLRNDTLATEAAGARRIFEIIGLQNLLLAQGRDEEALERVDAHVARWNSGTSLYLLDAPHSTTFAERARKTAAADSLRWGPTYAGLDFPNRLWELGIFELSRGNLEIAAEVAAEFRRRAVAAGSGQLAGLARSLQAHLLLARGDTNRALREFDAIVPAVAPGDSLTYDEVWPRGAERLQLARLLAARGDYQRAIDVANVFDSALPVIYTLYLAPSLRLRADAAVALGDTRLASTFRARLHALQGRPLAGQ
jgi:tetratricopeptide (TPR) repeat protein